MYSIIVVVVEGDKLKEFHLIAEETNVKFQSWAFILSFLLCKQIATFKYFYYCRK